MTSVFSALQGIHQVRFAGFGQPLDLARFARLGF